MYTHFFTLNNYSIGLFYIMLKKLRPKILLIKLLILYVETVYLLHTLVLRLE